MAHLARGEGYAYQMGRLQVVLPLLHHRDQL